LPRRWGCGSLGTAFTARTRVLATMLTRGDDMVPPNGSSPTWQNWSQNLVSLPPANGAPYYFTPRTRADLQAVITAAVAAGVTVRVSGQRHSQPPLVIDDRRTSGPATPDTYLVDLSCYADLGNGTQRMVLDAVNGKLTVNAGVREDEVDALL